MARRWGGFPPFGLGRLPEGMTREREPPAGGRRFVVRRDRAIDRQGVVVLKAMGVGAGGHPAREVHLVDVAMTPVSIVAEDDVVRPGSVVENAARNGAPQRFVALRSPSSRFSASAASVPSPPFTRRARKNGRRGCQASLPGGAVSRMS